MDSQQMKPYWVDEEARSYRVADTGNQTILSCRDKTSAYHYAELLNRAYRSGYKSGYRAGKSAGSKRPR